MADNVRKLYRSSHDKMVAGICGGFAEMFSVDSTLIRLGVVFLGLITAVVPLVIVYIIAWIIIPEGASE
ncbi:MAG: PspC domain-containing protein [Thermodesulfobacteriota bacterium]